MEKYEIKIDKKKNTICIMSLNTKKGCCFSYPEQYDGPLNSDERIGILLGTAINKIKK